MSDITYGDSNLIGTRDGKFKNIETGEIFDPDDLYGDMDSQEDTYPYDGVNSFTDHSYSRYDCE